MALALATPAAGQLSVEVSPLRVELTVGAGAQHTQAVTLANQGSDPVRIRARVQDWFMTQDGTPQFDAALPAADQKYAAAGWVRVAPPEQVVAPGETGTVRFTTSVPPDASDAGYRASVLFEFGPAGGDATAQRRQVLFRSRIATLVYLTVGTPQPAVDLVNLQPRVLEGQPPQIVVTLQNTGPVHVRTKGRLVIRDASGTVVRELDLPDAPVLPESLRDLAVTTASETQAPLSPGDYQVEVRVDVGLRALLVGETMLTVAR